MLQALKVLRATAIDQRVRDVDWREHEGEDIDGDAGGGSEQNAPSIEEAEEVADYETEDEGEGTTKERRERRRNAYMPPSGTPIANILETTRKRLENTTRTMILEYRRMWIAPGIDPLSFPGTPGNANKYLENEVWQFIWLPFDQFRSQVSIDNMKCINGCSCGSLKLNGKRWRPHFKHDEIVWVMYQRVHCKTCKRNTSTIDPRFLANMPTTVVERLPFITTASGPGVHRSMVYMLNNLKTKQMLEGGYAGTINELQRIRYDTARASYYDNVGESMAAFLDSNIGLTKSVPEPFPQFNSPGFFSGITCTRAMMTAAINAYMRAHEGYMQKSFETAADE
eukprot:scaffold475473_cov173-Attheya_sp.AAC.1